VLKWQKGYYQESKEEKNERATEKMMTQGGIPTVSFFGSRFPKCLKF
jgi:hypothetical protein